jgi:hypothetical protein
MSAVAAPDYRYRDTLTGEGTWSTFSTGR